MCLWRCVYLLFSSKKISSERMLNYLKQRSFDTWYWIWPSKKVLCFSAWGTGNIFGSLFDALLWYKWNKLTRFQRTNFLILLKHSFIRLLAIKLFVFNLKLSYFVRLYFLILCIYFVPFILSYIFRWFWCYYNFFDVTIQYFMKDIKFENIKDQRPLVMPLYTALFT